METEINQIIKIKSGNNELSRSILRHTPDQTGVDSAVQVYKG